MRKDKILYDIKESIRAYNKDAKITNAYIQHLVNVVRAEYIRQHQRRNPGEDKVAFTQTLFLEMETVDRSYLPNIPTDLTLRRTVKPLPTIIGKNILKNVEIRSVDRISQEIEYMDKVRAIHGASEYFIFAFLDDDKHIYLINKDDNIHKFIKKIAATVILFDPETIIEINELDSPLTEYPISPDMWARAKKEVLPQVLATMQIQIDTVDDNQTIQ